MNINATLYGKFVLVLAIVMTILCYYLGSRKTQTPKLVAAIGCVTCLFPPLALVYLVVLVLKDDIRVIE
ncbi:hypothetical protein [Planctobacterium marinum]|uniref:Uncharacterized protein n=1 Tax=Planctobacterium marinum TaxID=1631968 RepID=A0AA48HW52_9ALTE|nr:hypothetical protein MACH26_11860 [Planctobacterium marinum]